MRSAQRQVGEEQVVIDYDQPRSLRLAAHARDEAFLEKLAGLAQARVAGRGDLCPDRVVFRHPGKLGQIAGLSFLDEARQRVESSRVHGSRALRTRTKLCQ